MFCRNCGSQIEATDKFCPACGSAQTVTEPTAPVVDEAAKESRKEMLIGTMVRKSITGAAFSTTGILALVGWIISAGARRRVRKFEEEFGTCAGRPHAARLISNVGFGLGIGYTIFFTLYFGILIAATILAYA